MDLWETESGYTDCIHAGSRLLVGSALTGNIYSGPVATTFLTENPYTKLLTQAVLNVLNL